MTDEQRPNHEMDGVLECVQKVEKGQIMLVTGQSIIEMELLETTMSSEAQVKFNDLMKRRNCQKLPFDPRLHDRVRQIREGCRQAGIVVPKVGDATHLAYAIHYSVDELHTFDEAHLLPLDGRPQVKELTIRKPPVTQYRIEYP